MNSDKIDITKLESDKSPPNEPDYRENLAWEPRTTAKILGIATLGALLNRIRGGLWDIPGGKIIYPAWLGLVAGHWSVAPGAYLGQQVCGWGAYCGSATTGCKPAPENPVIDFLGRWLEKWPRIWGTWCLGLRGLLWNLCIALFGCWFIGTWSSWLGFVGLGLTMGLCYLLPGLALAKTKWALSKLPWNIGELIWGLVQSLGLWFLIGVGTWNA